jgi:hypothetical protein
LLYLFGIVGTKSRSQSQLAHVTHDGLKQVTHRLSNKQWSLEKRNYLHYVKFKLNLTHRDRVKKDGCTSIIDDGEDAARQWGLGQNLHPNLNNASNICTMHPPILSTEHIYTHYEIL